MSETVRQSYLNKARKDKFLLVFDLPPILKPIASKYTRNNKRVIPDSVQFSVFGTMVPPVVIKGVPARFAGDTLYVSSHSKDAPPPVNLKFQIDSGYNNYWAIYSWLNLLHDQKTGIYNQNQIPVDGNFNDYQIDLTVYGLDEYDEKVIKFNYTKAFPTSMDGITYIQNEDGEMEIMCGFTFLFSQMHVELVGADRLNFTTE